MLTTPESNAENEAPRPDQDAEAGGRYGSVLVTTATKDASTGDEAGMTPSSAIVSRIGTLFFLTIPGDTNIEGNLHSFTTLSLKKFFTEGPIKFQILFDPAVYV